MDYSSTRVEFTVEELMKQNRALAEELSICQKDKDFVWNLWKRLQVDKPDVSNAISMVLSREQEKADLKDSKVLSLLKEKDQQIRILEEIAADYQTQHKQANERLSQLLEHKADMAEKISYDKELINKLEAEVEYRKEMLNAKAMQHDFDVAVKESDLTKLKLRNEELEKQISVLENVKRSLQSTAEKVPYLEQQLESAAVEKTELLNSLQEKEEGAKALETALESTKAELARRDEQLSKQIKVSEDQLEMLEQQHQDLISLKKESKLHSRCAEQLAEQDQLIKNLEMLQEETHEVVRHQQKSHEKELLSFQQSITELSSKITHLQGANKKLVSENRMLREACEQCSDLQAELKQSKSGYQSLVESYRDKCRQVSTLEKMAQSSEFPPTSNPGDRPSANVSVEVSVLEQKLKRLREMSLRYEDLLHAKDAEVRELRQAHNQRLQRYNLLLESYSLVKEQLDTYDAVSKTSLVELYTPPPRADVRALQREESDSVWNELEYYRKEFNKLESERPKICEELDRLRVQNATSESTIKELQLAIENNMKAIEEKEEDLRGKANHVSPVEVSSLQKQIQIWKEKCHAKDVSLQEAQTRFAALEDTTQKFQQHESSLKKELDDLTAQLNFYKASRAVSKSEVDLQTESALTVAEDRVILDEDPDRLTDSVSPKHKSFSTQTSPRLLPEADSRNAEAVTTDDTSDSEVDGEKPVLPAAEKEERRQPVGKLKEKRDYAALRREKRSLTKRVQTLSAQVIQLKDAKSALAKLAEDTQLQSDGLKDELVVALQKLQVTKQRLKETKVELERCMEQRDILILSQEKEKQHSKMTNVEYKTMESKVQLLSEENSRLAYDLKTCRDESLAISRKLSDAQNKASALEKNATQKKAMVDEWREKYKEMKSSIELEKESSDNLRAKLKRLVEQDSKQRTYLESAKEKLAAVTSQKLDLQELLNKANVELAELRQHVKQEELVYSSVERTVKEIEENHAKQVAALRLQHKEVLRRKEKETLAEGGQVAEFKSVLKDFVRAILKHTRALRETALEQHRAKVAADHMRQRQMVLGSKAREIACAILNMSSDDIAAFMDADEEKELMLPDFDEDDTIRKINLIVERKSNFAHVLTRLLLELVEYNWTLREHNMASAEDA